MQSCGIYCREDHPTRRLLLHTFSAPPSSAPSPSPSLNPGYDDVPGAAGYFGNGTSSESGDGSFGMTPKLSTSMAIIVVSVMGVFLLVGLLVIYIRRCLRGDAESDDEGVQHSTSRRWNVNLQPRQSTGLDPALLESFPIVPYASAKKRGITQCVVCLREFESGEQQQLKQLPKCKHIFHSSCISCWLSSHSTCPICRRNLASISGRFSPAWICGDSSRWDGGSTSRSRRNRNGDGHSRLVGDAQGGETDDSSGSVQSRHAAESPGSPALYSGRSTHEVGESIARDGSCSPESPFQDIHHELATQIVPEAMRKERIRPAVVSPPAYEGEVAPPTLDSSRERYQREQWRCNSTGHHLLRQRVDGVAAEQPSPLSPSTGNSLRIDHVLSRGAPGS
ncbi:hypothetical protein KP509_12G015900 [Ceratopteris richardii]|uniref:RING-type E3 ubiquitin transferase n=1 Tax=Ceratopteris richardii TaxID=49495 RepID=A0A8T2TLI9_CERRI|nr:hypothetical protein KP509_12G015900 [Ceratopteris richardii]